MGLLTISVIKWPGNPTRAIKHSRTSLGADYCEDADRGREITSQRTIHDLCQRKWSLWMKPNKRAARSSHVQEQQAGRRWDPEEYLFPGVKIFQLTSVCRHHHGYKLTWPERNKTMPTAMPSAFWCVSTDSPNTFSRLQWPLCGVYHKEQSSCDTIGWQSWVERVTWQLAAPETGEVGLVQHDGVSALHGIFGFRWIPTVNCWLFHRLAEVN